MRRVVVLAVLIAVSAVAAPSAPAQTREAPERAPTATGTRGAASTVDPYATRAAVNVLRRGGNAVDAAVAAAGVLGVVEPYSCGIGGGGFMVIRTARGRLVTIDSRETAPRDFRVNSFTDPATGQPYPFADRVTSGLGVGVPGTVDGWRAALKSFGTRSLRSMLRPGIRLARRGFVVDPTFTAQTEANLERFSDFPATRRTFLRGGEAPAAGTVLRNRNLARTYERIGRRPGAFYKGAIARDIVRTVRRPPVREGADRRVLRGLMDRADLATYKVRYRRPAVGLYRGLQIVGMGPPSSGGSTIAEALNILERYPDLGTVPRDEALHRYLEASRLAFADRNAFLGDPFYVDVPLTGLLHQAFADTRPVGERAATSPVPPGDPRPFNGGGSARAAAAGHSTEGPSTTHLTVADRFGNVVSYTFTIEQTGGSGITVPGRGFLLNNELTDFDTTYPHPNAPAPGKRPRSSMSPTIVLRGDGEPLLAVGSPGGATIITTVLQILMNRIDLGMSLPDAVAAPRLSQRNVARTTPEAAAFPERAALEARGHAFDSPAEIGAATGIELLDDGRFQAVAEPQRRGGGSAMTVAP